MNDAVGVAHFGEAAAVVVVEAVGIEVGCPQADHAADRVVQVTGVAAVAVGQVVEQATGAPGVT